MKRGVQRWIVDISAWNFSPSEFTSAMSVLPQQEHSSITRKERNRIRWLGRVRAVAGEVVDDKRNEVRAGGSFYQIAINEVERKWYVKMEDRKRALVSRLLQYAVVHEVLGIPFDKIMIKRTVEGKPYLELDKIGHEFPNFNFSVSHHGDFVAIASEPLCLVGLDIVSHVIPVKETIPEFIEHFSPYFSSTEWSKITNCGTCDNMLEELYRYWSLKEAFVKAIGSGLGYSLDALEFHHCNWTNISLKIHGKEVRHWRFWHFVLRKRHYVSIARGHPHMASESYKKSLVWIDFEEDEYNMGFDLPDANFMWKTIEQIISS